MKSEDNLNILFNKGDIICISGNYKFNEKYICEDKFSISTIGIFAYFNELKDAFIKNNWDMQIIDSIINNQDLKSGIKIPNINKLENIFNDLYHAMENNNTFTIYSKCVELFHYTTQILNNKGNKKLKTYTQKQVQDVLEIKNFLDENLNSYYSMPQLAKMFNISLSKLQSIFIEYYGASPYKYHLNKRLEKAYQLITKTQMKMDEIAKSVGFSSYDNFFKAYNKKYNCNPSEHREKISKL